MVWTVHCAFAALLRNVLDQVTVFKRRFPAVKDALERISIVDFLDDRHVDIQTRRNAVHRNRRIVSFDYLPNRLARLIDVRAFP